MKWDRLSQSLGKCRLFPRLSSVARWSIHFRAVDQESDLGNPQPCCGVAVTLHSQVCSIKDNKTEGINPRTSFGSPDGEYRLVDVSGTQKEAVPWSPLLFSGIRSGSVVVQLVTSSSVGIYLALAEGWIQAGRLLPPMSLWISFPRPAIARQPQSGWGCAPRASS